MIEPFAQFYTISRSGDPYESSSIHQEDSRAGLVVTEETQNSVTHTIRYKHAMIETRYDFQWVTPCTWPVITGESSSIFCYT